MIASDAPYLPVPDDAMVQWRIHDANRKVAEMVPIIFLIVIACLGTAVLSVLVARAFPYRSVREEEYRAGRADEYYRLAAAGRVETAEIERVPPRAAEITAAATAYLPLDTAPVTAPGPDGDDDDDLLEATTFFSALADVNDDPITPPPPLPYPPVKFVPRMRGKCRACTRGEGSCTCESNCGSLTCTRRASSVQREEPADSASSKVSISSLEDVLSWGARMQAEISGWRNEDWAVEMPALAR